jgi:hypothetical protein
MTYRGKIFPKSMGICAISDCALQNSLKFDEYAASAAVGNSIVKGR